MRHRKYVSLRITKYVTNGNEGRPVGLNFSRIFYLSVRDFFTDFFTRCSRILFMYMLRALRMPADAAEDDKNGIDGGCDVMKVTLSKSAEREPIRRFSGPP
jgi:hypothetical protein